MTKVKLQKIKYANLFLRNRIERINDVFRKFDTWNYKLPYDFCFMNFNGKINYWEPGIIRFKIEKPSPYKVDD